uniref:Protein FAM107B n=1 Tax=Chelydra serpentina TaxID=8475 RepID=A0A8C3TJ60_CHESE
MGQWGRGRQWQTHIPDAGSNSGLIEPKKLPNPVRESKTHQELHRELLFSHRRGLLPEHKPELQKVLETRRFKQLKQQQESQRPLTDLEEELRKRHRMLEQVCASQSFTNPAPAATGSETVEGNTPKTAERMRQNL